MNVHLHVDRLMVVLHEHLMGMRTSITTSCSWSLHMWTFSYSLCCSWLTRVSAAALPPHAAGAPRRILLPGGAGAPTDPAVARR